ncbi:MAG: ureidoglycolate lyase [Clostridiales bacterium]|jgi:ureidoglycolate hydrolase|nr:ureidoglycolate lyase [Clostridiales bacterium]
MVKVPLTPRQASVENLKGFGEFIAPAAPNFSSKEFDWHQRLAVFKTGAAEIGLVCIRNTGCYEQRTLERHKRTKEAVLPVEGDVVMVLARGEASLKKDFAALYVPVGCGVLIGEGVWHLAPMCFSESAAAFIIYAEGTGENDKEVISLPERGLEVFLERMWQ